MPHAGVPAIAMATDWLIPLRDSVSSKVGASSVWPAIGQ